MKKTGPRGVVARKKILPKQHTGKVRHHRHTSYASLALILLLTFVPLFYASRAIAYAATDGGGSYQTYAVVAGPIPKVAPSITNLASGRTFTTSDPVVIKGGCESGMMVKIFKNGVLAGASLCQNGSYQLSIDLFVGNNSLIARAYNTNDVASPDSTPVSVQLVLPGTKLNGTEQLNTEGAPAGQFYVTSEVFYRGANAGDTMAWPLIVSGGQPPYAIQVSWGDGHSDLISRGDTNRVDISHVYAHGAGYKGSYTIVIKATDQAGNKSYLQLVALVSGDSPIGIIGGVKGGIDRSGVIKVAWQLLAVAIIVTLSFWLGEKREARLLRAPIKRLA